MPTTLEPVEVIETDVDLTSDTVNALDRPWIVLVWNDPVNLMSYVTYVFQKLFGFSLEKATELMLDVHEKGRAVVASGTREEAEMHVFRLHEHSLWATMEHDGVGDPMARRKLIGREKFIPPVVRRRRAVGSSPSTSRSGRCIVRLMDELRAL